VIFPYIRHGPSAYTADLIIVDNDTTTQLDCPPHMMAHQDSGLPNAGYWGFLTCDKLPAWQLVGQVVKIDGRAIYDQAPNGQSPIFTVDMVKQAEQALGRDLTRGDAVIYWSSYNDKRGAPGESPDRAQIDVLLGKAPAWPAPNFDTSDYVGSKGVVLVGLDIARALAPSARRTTNGAGPRAIVRRPSRRSKAILAYSSMAPSTWKGC
jgi:kynurenine formamidase